MPKLEHFQYTSNRQYPDWNCIDSLFIGEKEKNDQDPKNFVEKTGTIVIKPPIGRSRIEFEKKS